MKDPVRRDTLATVVGLSVMIVFFLYAVYMPGQRACSAAERDIAAAQRAIHEIPQRLQELQLLQEQVKQREAYLASTIALMPVDANMHQVVRQVAGLAAKADLHVTRLEPLDVVDHESYQEIPYRVSLTGEFPGVAALLQGLENQARMFTVRELALSTESLSNPRIIKVDMYFAVYIRRSEISDSSGNDAS